MMPRRNIHTDEQHECARVCYVRQVRRDQVLHEWHAFLAPLRFPGSSLPVRCSLRPHHQSHIVHELRQNRLSARDNLRLLVHT